MDAFVNEKDFALLARDPYTFAVLDRILRGPCELIRSDHQRLILCHSEAPYPVWLWTPDGLSDAEKERAWDLAAALRPFSAGYRFNMKYELAEYCIERSRQAGPPVGIAMQLFAYDCPDPLAPAEPTDGALHCCTQADVQETADLLPFFYTEIGDEPPAPARCRAKAQAYIDENAFFFWKNADGRTVACCSYKVNQGLASVGSVFTLPAYRRRHYAQHLVYQVTKKAQTLGFMPMLYTDANYPASNACYEKIGYVLRGKLCTVAALRR